MTTEKFSFEGQQEDLPMPQSLKIDGKKSRYVRQAENKQTFEKRAEEAHDKILGRQDEIYELGKQFLELMKDKTLLLNKGPMQQSLEREVLSKLINFAIELNNDELEKEGMGSVSLLTLLFRSNLVMRDKYNALEFKVEQLEKQLKSSPAQNHDK